MKKQTVRRRDLSGFTTDSTEPKVEEKCCGIWKPLSCLLLFLAFIEDSNTLEIFSRTPRRIALDNSLAKKVTPGINDNGKRSVPDGAPEFLRDSSVTLSLNSGDSWAVTPGFPSLDVRNLIHQVLRSFPVAPD